MDQNAERWDLLPPGWARIDEVLVCLARAWCICFSRMANDVRPGGLLFVVADLKHVFYRLWWDIRLGRASSVQHVSLRTAGDEAGEPIKALASE
jgi:hypothetical protein